MLPLSIKSNSGIKSYVLRAGKWTAAQRRSYDLLAGQFIIENIAENKLINFINIFGNDNPVVVEIGFGMGYATAIIADANPEKNYLGIEVHKPGIGRLLWEIENKGLSNIRIIEHDAVPVFEMIPPGSLEGLHVFFPDPWPKKRHHKRRLIKRPFTDTLASKLKPQGYLYMVTDWEDYANWALAELSATAALANAAGSGFSQPQAWRPHTAFEKKGLEKNHEVRELFFKRI